MAMHLRHKRLIGWMLLTFAVGSMADRSLAQNPALNGNRPPVSSVNQPPFPPLPPDHQKFLDQVLQLWEERSSAVERYRSKFKRWEYDPVFGPKDTFKTFSEGSIKFAAPDKGLFKVEKMVHYTPPAKEGEKPKYVEREGIAGEFWICDGKSVFEHDQQKKQLIQRELPPYMQGRAIADGPLPFLFGAKADAIKERYWIRPLPLPKDVQGEYWLEAFPKTRQDAVNYHKVHVIIDHQDLLPKGLVIFDRNFDPVRNPARTTFVFENRETNWNMVLQQLKFWEQEFYEPKVPYGWKKVVEKYQGPPSGDQFAPAATRPQEANRNLRPPAAQR
jgi:TIGR03009 family protein